MKSSRLDTLSPTQSLPDRPGLLSGWIRAGVLARLKPIRHGHLTIVDGDSFHTYGTASDGSPRATVRVLDPRFYASIALLGSVGAGESYMDGYWTSDSLTDAVRVIARNRRALASMEGGVSRAAGSAYRFLHWLRRNTRSGSRRNIREHYDLGNDFFALFLDETMMYSCAYFDSDESSLQEASLSKIERICRKLDLGPEDHLLEIGTGWGGFAVHAASRHGCRVTTTTVSEEQYRLARERVRERGLEDRVTVLLRDYRDLEGRYDKLVSIEMIEAVGYEFLDGYFRKCDELLKPGGRMVLQAITIADELLDQARNSVDFIKRHIFPGSALPAVGQMRRIVEDATRLQWIEREDLTAHYARTLRIWRERFLRRLDDVRALGYSERFIRMWEFYLSYCEAGFLEGRIGNSQIILERR